MISRLALCLTFLLLAVSGCQQPNKTAPDSAKPTPLFEGMGHHAKWIQTSSPDAQAYFNQGLTWAFAFNHDEAIRSFQEATRRDPNCAMAYWGIALCNGPHINNPVMTPEQSKAAWEAAQKAVALSDKSGYPEQQLIKAVVTRYAAEAPADRKPLNEAYAAAMKEVYELDIHDADIGTLYAESLMDLQPWDLWEKDGSPKGRTTEILELLEHALTINPNHPGANHLYIHAVEASPHPERAIASADRLRDMIPMSGHLVHMPSHIDVRVGEWAKAADQNVQAAAADAKYRAISPRQGFYRVYMAHNHQFLSFASMMEGRREVAMQAARKMINGIPKDYARSHSALVDPSMMIAMDVMMRFGQWDEILREPKPPTYLPITTAFRLFARGTAYAAKGDVKHARREQKAYREAAKKVPEDARMAINPAHKILDIADHMLEGEIAYSEGKIDEAVAALREAIKIEDSLLYMEPPEWLHPVRQPLGAILLAAGRTDEAEQVYREDLKYWPENGWSLYGLSRCMHAKNDAIAAKNVDARFARTWARSDTKIGSSCLCVKAGSSE